MDIPSLNTDMPYDKDFTETWIMNRQEVLKICHKCSGALREQNCTFADFEASKLDTISLVPSCVIEQMKVLTKKKEVLSHVDNLAPLNENIYDDNNIKQQKESGIENNELSVEKQGGCFGDYDSAKGAKCITCTQRIPCAQSIAQERV